MYLKGVSTNAFPEALKAILGEKAGGLSPATIVRLKRVWEEEYKEWSTRDLTGKRYVYFWADGIYFNVRLTDDRPCFLVIMGTLEDGTKELVAIGDGERESKLSWKEDLALAYKQLMRVEEAWRTMKSGLNLRPVYHRTPERIQAHVYLCVLGLLIERVAEKATGETWRNIRNTLRTQKIGQLFTPNGRVFQASNPDAEVCNIYKLLKIDPPKHILSVE